MSWRGRGRSRCLSCCAPWHRDMVGPASVLLALSRKVRVRPTPITTAIAAMFLVCIGVLAVLMPWTAQHNAFSTPSLIVGAVLIGGVIGFWLNRL